MNTRHVHYPYYSLSKLVKLKSLIIKGKLQNYYINLRINPVQNFKSQRGLLSTPQLIAVPFVKLLWLRLFQHFQNKTTIFKGAQTTHTFAPD